MARARTSHDDLPPGVREFIERRIESVEQLEILMFLYRAPSRFREAADIAQSLDLAEQRVAHHLERLASGGLLDVRIASVMLYRFNPASSMLMLEVQQLAAAYRDHRGEMLGLLTPRPRRALKDFSDAFRFSRDPEDG